MDAAEIRTLMEKRANAHERYQALLEEVKDKAGWTDERNTEVELLQAAIAQWSETIEREEGRNAGDARDARQGDPFGRNGRIDTELRIDNPMTVADLKRFATKSDRRYAAEEAIE